MVERLVEEVLQRLNYYVYVVLTLIGFYAMITRAHLLRQLVGLTIFQTSIILFFVSMGAKWGAGLPIAPAEGPALAEDHVNPLPHALMLTAIVVAVATQGLAMTLLVLVRRNFGTLDEDDLFQRLRGGDLESPEPRP